MKACRKPCANWHGAPTPTEGCRGVSNEHLNREVQVGIEPTFAVYKTAVIATIR